MLRLLLFYIFLHQTQGYGVRVKADVDIGDDTGLGLVVREFMQKYLKDGEAEIDVSEMIQHLQQLITTKNPNLASHAKKANSKHQKDNDLKSKHAKSEKHEVVHENEEIEHKFKKKYASKNVSKDNERNNKKRHKSKKSKKNQSDDINYNIERESKKNHDSKKMKHSERENINGKRLKHQRNSKDRKVGHHDKEKVDETEQSLENHHPADSFSDDSAEKTNDDEKARGEKHYSTKSQNKTENRDLKTSKHDESCENFEDGGRKAHTIKSLKKSLPEYDSSKENEKGEIDKVKAERNRGNEDNSEEIKENQKQTHIFGKHEEANVKDPLNKIKA